MNKENLKKKTGVILLATTVAGGLIIPGTVFASTNNSQNMMKKGPAIQMQSTIQNGEVPPELTNREQPNGEMPGLPNQEMTNSNQNFNNNQEQKMNQMPLNNQNMNSSTNYASEPSEIVYSTVENTASSIDADYANATTYVMTDENNEVKITEAGTYIVAGALAGDKLKITNLIPKHLESFLSKLEEMGVKLDIGTDYVVVTKPKKLKAVNIKTLTYPGFATDLQQPITPLLCLCTGKSRLEETIYENRFKHVPYLVEMGAKIETLTNRIIEVNGPIKFKSAHVSATDLRAGACMILAALAADGKVTIDNAHYILRGYENIKEKLENVGASIKIIDK